MNTTTEKMPNAAKQATVNPPADARVDERLFEHWRWLSNLLNKTLSPKEREIVQLPSDLPSKSDLSLGLENLTGNCSRRVVFAEASKFLFRKCYPSKIEKKDIEKYIEKMGRTAPFNASVQDALDDICDWVFPVGWDKGYVDKVNSTIPSVSGSVESSSFEGGVRGYFSGINYTSEMFKAEAEGLKVFKPMEQHRILKAVPAKGKERLVTLASANQIRLRPMHDLIYDRISRFEFILRGDAKIDSLCNMTRASNDEVFVSGDYESATDNLSSRHSVFILQKLRSRSRNIPYELFDEAIRSMNGTFQVGRDKPGCPPKPRYVQSNGQMMGNFLSFPLLCITNLLGVVLAFGIRQTKRMSREGILKINGDDIVFRCSLRDSEKWFDSVQQAGLVLSRGKTLVHKRIFSINSTFFCATDKRIQLIPVIRSLSIYNGIENPQNGIPQTIDGIIRSLLWGLPSTFGGICLRAEVEKRLARRNKIAIREGLRERVKSKGVPRFFCATDDHIGWVDPRTFLGMGWLRARERYCRSSNLSARPLKSGRGFFVPTPSDTEYKKKYTENRRLVNYLSCWNEVENPERREVHPRPFLLIPLPPVNKLVTEIDRIVDLKMGAQVWKMNSWYDRPTSNPNTFLELIKLTEVGKVPAPRGSFNSMQSMLPRSFKPHGSDGSVEARSHWTDISFVRSGA
jgi:hypothetical protein